MYIYIYVSIYINQREKNEKLANFLARAFDLVFFDSHIYNDININPFLNYNKITIGKIVN